MHIYRFDHTGSVCVCWWSGGGSAFLSSSSEAPEAPEPHYTSLSLVAVSWISCYMEEVWWLSKPQWGPTASPPTRSDADWTKTTKTQTSLHLCHHVLSQHEAFITRHSLISPPLFTDGPVCAWDEIRWVFLSYKKDAEALGRYPGDQLIRANDALTHSLYRVGKDHQAGEGFTQRTAERLTHQRVLQSP